jgi:thiol-disulfide isomerase/thioredoxin
VSRGLIAAVALAVVVLAVATFTAFRSDDDTTETLTPGATLAPGAFGTNGLDAGEDVAGQPLPDFTVTNFDGSTAPLSTDGRPLVINFWASYCGPCVAEMPAIEQVYQANRDRIGVLGLQVQEAAELGLPLAEKTGVTYPLGRDPKGELVRELGGMNLPTTVFVAADGTITDVHVGAVTAPELQALIDEHLPA